MFSISLVLLGLLANFQYIFAADALPKINEITESQVVSVGDDVEFNCSVENVGGYTVGWSKFKGGDESNNGGAVVLSIRNMLSLTDPRYTITEKKDNDTAHYTFKITKVEASDMGIYECQVIISSTDKVTKNVRLSVRHPPIISEELTPKSITATEGQSMEIKCHANGYPQPTISWQREDNSVMPTGSNSFAGNTLRLVKAHRLDRGAYVCIADNGVGKPSKKIIHVEVEFRPQISVPRPKVSQIESYEVNLECIVQGSPSPAVSWHKNGEQLKSGSSYVISSMAYAHETTKSVLNIPSVRESDFGDYYCNATNKLGHADARLHLFRSVIPIPAKY